MDKRTDPPATLLWRLCPLRVRLEGLACILAALPPDAFVTAF
jgi:hypothetical protein